MRPELDVVGSSNVFGDCPSVFESGCSRSERSTGTGTKLLESYQILFC
jgi:hypothetical protein